jgi:hypothetical protein
MKLNFWQWLGVLCLIGGAIGYIYFEDREKKPDRQRPPVQTTTAPATAP